MKFLRGVIFLAVLLLSQFLSAQQININSWQDLRNMQNPCDSVSIKIIGDMDATYAQGPVNVTVTGFTVNIEVIMIYGFATMPVSPNIAWTVNADLGYLPLGNYALNITSKLSTVPYDFMTDSFSIDHKFTFLEDSTICNGDSLKLNGQIYGMSSPTYSWSNGKTTQQIYVADSGLYILTATGSNCTVTDTMLLTLTPKIQDILVDTGSTVCIGDSVQLGGGPSYYTYKWSNNSTSDALTWVFQSAGNETIWVKVSDSLSCTSREEVTFIVEDCDTLNTGISDGIFENQWSLYPNPSAGRVNLSTKEDFKGSIILEVISQNGKVIFRSTYTDTRSLDLNLSNQSSGLYFINVMIDSQQYSGKLLIQR